MFHYFSQTFSTFFTCSSIWCFSISLNAFWVSFSSLHFSCIHCKFSPMFSSFHACSNTRCFTAFLNCLCQLMLMNKKDKNCFLTFCICYSTRCLLNLLEKKMLSHIHCKSYQMFSTFYARSNTRCFTAFLICVWHSLHVPAYGVFQVSLWKKSFATFCACLPLNVSLISRKIPFWHFQDKPFLTFSACYTTWCLWGSQR